MAQGRSHRSRTVREVGREGQKMFSEPVVWGAHRVKIIERGLRLEIVCCGIWQHETF